LRQIKKTTEGHFSYRKNISQIFSRPVSKNFQLYGISNFTKPSLNQKRKKNIAIIAIFKMPEFH
jgi:hypothetical protein